MTKRQQEQAINEAIKGGVRLTEDQVQFAAKHGICLWGSVNYNEHENAIRNSAEYQRVRRMTSVVDRFDVNAYQRNIYSNGFNR